MESLIVMKKGSFLKEDLKDSSELDASKKIYMFNDLETKIELIKFQKNHLLVNVFRKEYWIFEPHVLLKEELIDKVQLQKIFPKTPKECIENLLYFLNLALALYKINTPMRISHFLAQIGVESGGLIFTRELGSGEMYNNRKDLGNDKGVGYGVKYKGRGLIQITGYYNYQKISESLGIDFVKMPELLEKPKYACLSAGWFWNNINANKFADQNDISRITKIINGGYNGFEERKKIFCNAQKILTEGV